MNNKRIKNVISGLLVGILVFEAFNLFGGIDLIKSAFYEPSPEMSKIIGKLDLTERGKLVLGASSPVLEPKDEFNEKCNSHNAEIYVLGCYQTSDDAIHLYNVYDDELDGIKESTTAHELLHAVYKRLPFWEKSALNEQMQKYYDTLDEKNDIKETMKLYKADDFYDELHSRLGTEVKNLPDNLEKHYESIFKNQDKIVNFYENYSGVFKKYREEVTKLGEKIEKLKTEIENEEKSLTQKADNLNNRISDYNNRASRGQYSSYNAIVAEGNRLKNEVTEMNKAYDALNKKVDECNNAISEYNKSVVKTNKIYESINSNSNKLKDINK